MALCEAITKIKEVGGNDLLQVTVDGQTAYWMYTYADAVKFLNKEVDVEYHSDFLDGKVAKFVSNIVEPQVIQTVDKVENIRLYSNQVDNESNVSFNDCVEGETIPSAKVFCLQMEYASSTKAKWAQLTIRDRSMRTAICRVFDYESTDPDLTGSYVCCDLMLTKYGFNADCVTPVSGISTADQDKVLAKTYIENVLASHPIMKAFADKHAITANLEAMHNTELIRLASELEISRTLMNVSGAYDVLSIQEALLCSYIYAENPDSVMSHETLAIIHAISTKWENKQLVCQILDPAANPETYVKERLLYHKVRELADVTIKAREGLI